MAKDQVQLMEGESSIDYLTKSHISYREDNQDHRTHSYGGDFEDLSDFLSQHRADLSRRGNSDREFFRVHGSPIYGVHGSPITGGTIPLFRGAALELDTALLTGEKRWFRDPKAVGKGGTLVLFPDYVDEMLMLPINTELTLKPDYVEGVADLVRNSGFGRSNQLIPRKIMIKTNEIYFENAVAKRADETESIIPKITLSEEGLVSDGIDNQDIYDFINYSPDVQNPIEPEVIMQDEPVQESVISNSPNQDIIDAYLQDYEGDRCETFKVMHIREHEHDIRITLEAGKNVLELNGVTKKEDGSYEAKSLDMKTLGFTKRYSDLKIKGREISCTKEPSRFVEINMDHTVANFDVRGDDLSKTRKKGMPEMENARELNNWVKGEANKTAYDEQALNKMGKAHAGIMIPIFPGLSFKTGVYASYLIAYSFINPGVKGLHIPFNSPDSIVSDDGLEGFWTFNIKGGASAGIFIGLVLGSNVIANLTGELRAALSFLSEAKIVPKFKIKKIKGPQENSYEFESLSMDTSIGTRLKAGLEGVLSVNVLTWGLDLYRYKIVEKVLGVRQGILKGGYNFSSSQWEMEAGASYDAIVMEGADWASQKDNLEKMMQKEKVVGMKFNANQLSYNELQENLEKAREILSVYRRRDGQNQVLIPLEEGSSGYIYLNKQIIAFENGFYHQMLKNMKLKEENDNLVRRLEESDEVADATRKKAFIERKLDELNGYLEIRNTPRIGLEPVEGWEVAFKKLLEFKNKLPTKLIGKDFYKEVQKDAVATLKSHDKLKEYETNKLRKIEMPYKKRMIRSGEYAANILKLSSPDEQSEKLYEYYKKLDGNLLMSGYHLVVGKNKFEEYIESKTNEFQNKKANQEKIIFYKNHMRSMMQAYKKLQRAGKENESNVDFYSKYAIKDAKALPIKSLNNKVLKQFLEEFFKGNDVTNRSLNKYDTFKEKLDQQKALKAQEGLSQEEQATLNRLTSEISNSMELEKSHLVKNLHKQATTEDFIAVRKKQALVKKMQSDLDEENETNKEWEVEKKIDQKIEEDLHDRTDALDVLIKYEESHRQYKPYIDALKKAKSEFENEDIALTDRYKIRTEAIWRYLHPEGVAFDRLKEIRDSIMDDYETDILYDESQIEDYDGVGDMESAYGAMQRHGHRHLFEKRVQSTKNHEAVARVVKSRELTPESLLRYYEYKARRRRWTNKENDLAVTIHQQMNDTNYLDMCKLMDRNTNLKGAYIEYISKNKETLITPNMLMQYDEKAISAYENPYKAHKNALDGDKDAQRQLLRSELGVEFRKSMLDQKGNTISFEDIRKIESKSMSLNSAMQDDLLDKIKSKEITHENYRGSLKPSKKQIKTETERSLNDVNYLSNKYKSFLEEEQSAQIKRLESIEMKRNKLQEMTATLETQMAKCFDVIHNAESVLRNPRSELDNFETNVIDQVVNNENVEVTHNQLADMNQQLIAAQREEEI